MKKEQEFFRLPGLKRQPRLLNISNFSRYITFNPIRRKREAIPYKIAKQILIDHNFKCDICGREVTLEKHHIVSRQIGDQDPGNFRLVCRHCHRAFRHRKPEPWNWQYHLKGGGY